MKYLIIGLGIYGSNLAADLAAMGHEVIGADVKPALVESIKDRISTAYIIDSTDEAALSMLPLKNVDLVIVAIGENFGASVKTVALLKKIGVEHIYARAIDPLHEAILEGFHVDRIITPEQRAASDLVHEMSLGNHVETLRVDERTFVIKFQAPTALVGMSYSELRFEEDYHLRLIAVTRRRDTRNILGANRPHSVMLTPDELHSTTVFPGDSFITLGTTAAFRTLSKTLTP